MLDMEQIIQYTSKLNLLYVEDNEATRKASLIILEEFFDNIILAFDGIDGLKKFKNNPIDLIISDINMPNLNGLDMIKKIKKIDATIPTLILSAHNETNFFIESIKLGIEGYLLKPMDLDQFLSILSKVTEKIKFKQEAEDNLQILNEYQYAIDKSSIVSKTDLNGIITYVNDEFCTVSGYNREALISQLHNIIRHPDVEKSHFEDIWHTIKNGKRIWQGSIVNKNRLGENYYLYSTIKPILDKDGNILEYIAISHNTTNLVLLNNTVKERYNYDIQQQKIAKHKLEIGIVNHMLETESQIIYEPLDILSGDFYSIYKCKDGRTFIYLIDGQGHGVSPALTVFSVSSVINNIIESIDNLEELINHLFPIIQNFLGEIEQLSYTMIMIDRDAKTFSYTSAGMYPFLINTQDGIIKIKSNNTPFMDFSPNPIVQEITISQWDDILIYSDGLVEHENNNFDKLSPEELIKNPSLIEQTRIAVQNTELDDDVTLLYIQNR